MRAITWTQVAQYVVLLLAFLIPVSWLAYKQLGNPVARWCMASRSARSPIWSAVAGLAGQIPGHGTFTWSRRRLGTQLQNVELALETSVRPFQERIHSLRAQNADVGLIVAASPRACCPAA